MRELKIFAVVVVITLITYWGIEPFAHSQMHPSVEPAEYSFGDVDGLKGMNGSASNGAELVASNCTACHSIESQGFPAVMDHETAAASYGVVPPDLGSSGLIYDKNYLAAFIKDPVTASKLNHVFGDDKAHPMPGYDWMSDEEIADVVAYLQSIAPASMTNKEVFTDACQRCHSIHYGDMMGGSMAAYTPKAEITAYMGKLPPDISQHVISRGEKYLHEFINDPQKHLEGTAMPRVGLTQDSEAQVIAYMSEVGDSNKDERNSLGVKVLAYLVIFAVFAWLWKAKIWRDL
ncbi:MAG: cytochrome c1 [Arcobacter butzleri]|nr:cytochrome c1 [Aliarcobacter butzleri]